jgi:hypothetical protein
MNGRTRPIPTRRPGKSSPTGARDKVLLPAARFGQQPAAWLLRAPMMLGFGTAAIRGKPVTGLYQAVGGGGLELTAGWLGVPLAVVAIYGGFALLLEDTSGRAVLPIGQPGRLGCRAVRWASTSTAPQRRPAPARSSNGRRNDR